MERPREVSLERVLVIAVLVLLIIFLIQRV